MQENIDMLNKIAVALNVPNDTASYNAIVHECQEICAQYLVEASETLQQIYFRALDGMTINEIRHDLTPEVLSRREQFEREVRMVRTLFDAQLITNEEAVKTLNGLSEEYEALTKVESEDHQ